MTSRDVYWIAGLLEGEGSFNYTYHKGANPRITIHMTDRDVLEKLRALTGTGTAVNVVNKTKPVSGWKVCYGLMIYGKLSIGLMMTVYPLMGTRRQQSIRDILHLWKEDYPCSLKDWRNVERFRPMIEARQMIVGAQS